jgi:hypothetical protein
MIASASLTNPSLNGDSGRKSAMDIKTTTVANIVACKNDFIDLLLPTFSSVDNARVMNTDKRYSHHEDHEGHEGFGYIFLNFVLVFSVVKSLA